MLFSTNGGRSYGEGAIHREGYLEEGGGGGQVERIRFILIVQGFKNFFVS